jgi:hypothetical protein
MPDYNNQYEIVQDSGNFYGDIVDNLGNVIPGGENRVIGGSNLTLVAGGPGGNTNLTITGHTALDFTLNSDTGADVILPGATPLLAGLLQGADKLKLNNTPADTTTALTLKQNLADKGIANGYAGLDAGGKIPTTQLPASILGNVSYQGSWNANTNTPVLANGVGTKGHYYIVSVAGSTAIDGISDWVGKDWIIYNGSSWEKVDNTDAVASVFGRAGIVAAVAGDYTALQVTNTPAGNIAAVTVQAALNELDTEKADDTLVVHKALSETITGAKTLQNKLELDTINDTITNPALRIRYNNMLNGDDSKGGIVEWGGVMAAATAYPYGEGTETFVLTPAATYTVGTTGYKSWVRQVTHYNSPLTSGLPREQSYSIETVAADYTTFNKRFRISYGENTAYVSFPNSNVRYYSNNNIVIGGDTNNVKLRHDSSSNILEVTNNPWWFKDGQAIKIGGSNGTSTTRLTIEQSANAGSLTIRNTNVLGNTQPNIIVESQTSTSIGYQSGAQSDAVKRFSIPVDGLHEWGSGLAARDTNLYRSATNTLKTDGKFVIGTTLQMGTISTVGQALVANDVNGNVSFQTILGKKKIVVNLTAGSNIITHNLNLTDPDAITVFAYDQTTGQQIVGSIPTRLANSFTFTVATSTINTIIVITA